MELSVLEGLSEAALNKLTKAGIKSNFDLACFFPVRYIDATNLNRFDLFSNDQQVVVCGRFVSVVVKRVKGFTLSIAEFVFKDFRYTACFFNQPYVQKYFKQGVDYFLAGKFQSQNGVLKIVSPRIIPALRMRPIVPIYKNIGVKTAVLEKAISLALSKLSISSLVDNKICKEFGLMTANKAFKCMHYPSSLEELKLARHSLSVQNIAGHIKRFNDVKRSNNAQNKGFSYKNKDILSKIRLNLGFSLTQDQENAVAKVANLMDLPTPMNVMLQGDVGSGKTAVCFFAAAYAAANGFQAAFMAPTELLARQHFKTAQRLLAPLGIFVELLVGSLTTKQAKSAKENIASGVAQVVVGTHSLFQNGVIFNNLSLIITDEQHRFGVNQRGALENKAQKIKAPDCIVVSATPIPRTLSLIIYGDLEPVIIRQKPQNRAEIKTYFVGSKVEQLYNYIYEKAQKGEQSYIVCPRVREDSENSEDFDENSDFDDCNESGNDLVSAQALYKELSAGVLKGCVGLLHGQMKDEEKMRIMEEFAQGKIMVLVTTTVIEVGIDVANATTIVIHNAERYGLSQLHQLRGRVGRGSLESCCFLLATAESYEKRLKFFQTCTDGFLLAEKDLDNRGGGDFLGKRQHGASLTLSGEPITSALLLKAKDIAARIQAVSENLSGSQIMYFKGLTLN